MTTSDGQLWRSEPIPLPSIKRPPHTQTELNWVELVYVLFFQTPIDLSREQKVLDLFKIQVYSNILTSLAKRKVCNLLNAYKILAYIFWQP